MDRQPTVMTVRLSTHRRLVGLLAGLVPVAAVLAMAPAASAAPKAKVDLVTSTVPAMHSGETAWVSTVWSTSATITDFTATMSATDGATVAYPAGRAFTSLYGSSSLAGDTQDFAAFKITVPYSASGSVTVSVSATWVDGSKGKPDSLTSTVIIPLSRYAGPSLTQVTTQVSVPRATPTWVQLRFTGSAPMLDGFRVSVTGPTGLAVVYPGDGSSSGLNGTTGLQGGVTDYAGIRLDAGKLTPGSYALRLTETFSRPDPTTETGTVTLVVA
ncbi:MAG: hypothetical protein JF603_06685 [Acidobacteria bacterium]|nr:hypothetical protein [Acidobacteriota bacterium]